MSFQLLCLRDILSYKNTDEILVKVGKVLKNVNNFRLLLKNLQVSFHRIPNNIYESKGIFLLSSKQLEKWKSVEKWFRKLIFSCGRYRKTVFECYLEILRVLGSHPIGFCDVLDPGYKLWYVAWKVLGDCSTVLYSKKKSSGFQKIKNICF